MSVVVSSLLSEEGLMDGMSSLVEGRMREGVAVLSSVGAVVSVRSIGVARMVRSVSSIRLVSLRMVIAGGSS